MKGTEHWTKKQGDIRLFLWHKPSTAAGAALALSLIHI